ncbi:MAG: hypothetical protein JSW69_00885 [Deltaproteobacteria bacterium]|nr:MAG: hypothetical protein JSW69_00885 [Deltaproteobacteria bacterium]
MKKTICTLFVIMAIFTLNSTNLFARGNNPGPVIYVVSQDLLYDSIVAAETLPMKGPFQELYPCEVSGSTGLCTEYGPGDFGFYGGRWWIDANGNEEMDEEDVFFSCPLLGPGRELP